MPTGQNINKIPSNGWTKAFWPILFCAGLPWTLGYLNQLWGWQEYAYVPFLLVATLTLVFFKWDRQLESPRIGSLILAIGSLLIITFGIFSNSPWSCAVGLLLGIGSFLLNHHNKLSVNRTLFYLFPCCLLFIRLPKNYDQSLVKWIDGWSIQLSSRILDSLSITHRFVDQSLEIKGYRWAMAQLIEGYLSVYAVIGIFLVYLSYRSRSLAVAPIAVILAIIVYSAMSIIQIAWTASMASFLGVDWALGWKRAIVLLVVVGFSLGMLLSMDRFLQFFFSPTSSDYINTTSSNPIARFWNWLFESMGHKDNPKESSKSIAWRQPPQTKLTRISMMVIMLVSLSLFVLQIFHSSIRAASAPLVSWSSTRGDIL